MVSRIIRILHNKHSENLDGLSYAVLKSGGGIKSISLTLLMILDQLT